MDGDTKPSQRCLTEKKKKKKIIIKAEAANRETATSDKKLL